MTYRERRLAKAERLRTWADSRESKAVQHRAAADEHIAMVPLGQPILVGHHSERRARNDQARFVRNMDKSIEHGNKAEEMRSRAANIEAAAKRAIYSDDPDAIERLEAKIKLAEELRESIRLFNASCRKGVPDFSLLSEQMQKNHEEIRKVGMLGDKQQFPPFFTSNLSGQLNRDKKRLESLKRKSVAA